MQLRLKPPFVIQRGLRELKGLNFGLGLSFLLITFYLKVCMASLQWLILYYNNK